MRVGSLFSGVGGFDLAFERTGMELTWTVECDKQARSVLRKHWPGIPHYEDVHDAEGHKPDAGHDGASHGSVPWSDDEGRSDNSRKRADTLAPVDLICGGFPCQDYSVAGKRGGLAGDRGALWWEMHRIIAECRPTWVVGENVPGLLSSRGGRDFLTIIASLVELGYGCTWAVVDSRYFGVAQRRRRLFIVGHSGGVPRPEVLALSEGLYGHPAPCREAGERVAPSVTAGAPFARTGNERVEAAALVAHTLRAEGFDASEDGTGRGTPLVVAFDWQQGGDDTDEMTATLSTTRTQAVFDPISPTGYQGDTFVPVDGPAHCLPAGGGNLGGGGGQLLCPTVPRRLTPTECERLQGFPDGWTDVDGMKDGPRYRMMGNAVTVNVISWIGRRIMELP